MPKPSLPEDSLLLDLVQSVPPAPIRRGIADEQLYRYHDGVWDAYGEDEAQRRLDGLYSQYPASKLRAVRYLLHGIEPTMPPVPTEATKYLVNTANGAVDVLAHPAPALMAASPDHFFRYKIPHEYDPKAQCPAIDAALARMFPDPDMVQLVYEIFGYCLLPGVNLKKAILFHSRAPHTGKSSLLNLLGALVGQENEATVSLQDLDDHRFARASLQGKLINRSGDLGAYAPRTSANFKSLVGGDPVLAEHKGQKQFPLHNTAKLLFAGNSFAGTHEQGSAYTSRWLVIPFEVVHQPNPDFLAAVTTPDELRGLLRHAIEGAARLAARREFPEVAAVALAERALQRETDSVARFVEETLTTVPAATQTNGLSGAGLYKDYEEWAKDGGMKPVSRPNFYNRVQDMPGAVIKEGRARAKMIFGYDVAFPTDRQSAEALRERMANARDRGI